MIGSGNGCLEVADKYFAWRGFGAIVSLPGAAVAGFMLWISASGLLDQFVGERPSDFVEAVAALSFGVVISTALLLTGAWLLLRESFTLTHYPIRFNRKNRMVVGAGANVLSFGRFQNAEGFVAA